MLKVNFEDGLCNSSLPSSSLHLEFVPQKSYLRSKFRYLHRHKAKSASPACFLDWLKITNCRSTTQMVSYAYSWHLAKTYFPTDFPIFLALLSSFHAHNLEVSAILGSSSSLASHIHRVTKSSLFIPQNSECLGFFSLLLPLFEVKFYQLDKHLIALLASSFLPFNIDLFIIPTNI